MGQSLFDPGAAPAGGGGVLEQMAEGQERLQADLALVAERLEQLETRQAGLSSAHGALLERLQAPAPAPARTPLYLAVSALVLAAAALILVLR